MNFNRYFAKAKEFQANSQNMEHEDPGTTFKYYSKLARNDIREVILNIDNIGTEKLNLNKNQNALFKSISIPDALISRANSSFHAPFSSIGVKTTPE